MGLACPDLAAIVQGAGFTIAPLLTAILRWPTAARGVHLPGVKSGQVVGEPPVCAGRRTSRVN